MSVEMAKAFIERMKTDEDFYEKVMSLGDFKRRLEYVAEAGYLFTEKDIDTVLAEQGATLSVPAASGTPEPATPFPTPHRPEVAMPELLKKDRLRLRTIIEGVRICGCHAPYIIYSGLGPHPFC